MAELPDGRSVLILGGGKVGTDLAVLLAEQNEVVVASRFSAKDYRDRLHAHRIETIEIELAPDNLDRLPARPDLVFLQYAFHAKAAEQPDRAFAINTHLTGVVAERFRNAAALVSSGTVNVFDRAPQDIVDDHDWEAPHGPYGLSRYAAEVLLGQVSRTHGTPVAILRYGYGNGAQYGLLRRLTTTVAEGGPIPLSMGDRLTFIGHEDLVRYTALAPSVAASPPEVINTTGPAPVPLKEVVDRIVAQGGFAPPSWEPGERSPQGLQFRCRKLVDRLGPPEWSWERLVDRAVDAQRRGVEMVGQS